MSAVPVAQRAAWADPTTNGFARLLSRIYTFCLVEVQKLRHDRSELVTRAIQPILWLVVFGQTFSHIRAIPTGDVPYLDFLAPGIIAQSALFVAIFYGIQIIWERDAGVLTKLMVTPTPRAALVTGKAFAAGIRAVAQAVVVVVVAALLGVSMTWNPIKLLGVVGVVVLGSAFFACLSVAIAGIVLKRDRLMGTGQAITMPLFFASNALPGRTHADVGSVAQSHQSAELRGVSAARSADRNADRLPRRLRRADRGRAARNHHSFGTIGPLDSLI
ncbi:transport permease protein [Rhodococcus qingshengii]|nr:transport permease protein [Rhodococcus qingshengii]